MKTRNFIFGIIKEDIGFTAVNIKDISYLTCGDDENEVLENIKEVIELLDDDEHRIVEEDDFSLFCCYWLIEYNNGNVKLIKKVKNLNEL